MVLPDIKALKELLKLLRSQGVLQFQSADLNLVLSETAPVPARSTRSVPEEELEPELSEEAEIERLLFYSATPPTESSES